MSIHDEAGAQWDLDPNLLRGLEWYESGGKTTATSPAGAEGNMQFMPATARGVGVANTREPAFSIPGTAKHIHDLLIGPAKGDITTALRMYHGGPDQSKWGPANAAYAPGVLAATKQFAAKIPPPTAPLGFNPARMTDAELQAHLDAEIATAPKGDPKTAEPPSTSPTPDISKMTDVELAAHLDEQIPKAPQEKAPTPYERFQAKSPQARMNDMQTPGSDYYLSQEDNSAMMAGQQNALRGIGIGVNRLTGDPLKMLPGQIERRNAFDAQYGDNGAAQLGGMIGSMAATLPVMSMVNPLVARGVGVAANALSPYAPGAVSLVTGASRFLSGGSGLPNAAGGGSLPLQIASQATSGALTGAEAATINAGHSDTPVGQQALEGAAIGGALGAALPIAQRAGNVLSGASSGVDPDLARIARGAKDDYGIQLHPAQLGLNPALGYANNVLKMVPGSGVSDAAAKTQLQFNQAVSKTFGEDAQKITPTVLNRAQKRIGGTLERIEKSSDISFDTPFMNDLAQTETNARSSLTDQEFGVVRRQIDNVLTNLQPGDTISGTTYGDLIHKGSPLDAALNSSNSNIKHFAGQIRDALRDSLSRSLPTADAEAYREARTQYKNLMTVRPLTLRADTNGGPLPSTGDINPVALRPAVNRSYGDSVAMRGWGDVPLNDIATIGQRLRPMPDSGTAQRGSMIYGMTQGAKMLGAAATGAGGAYVAGLPTAAAGLAGGIAAGRLGGMYLNSPSLANRMIDASLNPLRYQSVNPDLSMYVPAIAALPGPRRNLLSRTER